MKTKSLKQAMGLLDRHLKPLGFERGGQVWHRGGGTVVAVIEFQRSTYSPTLTVNYGLFLGEASAMIWPDVARSAAPPDAAGCAIRRRITQEHDGADLWFDMTNPMWADDMVGTVLGRVVPYLAPLEDPVAMVRELAGNRPPLPQEHGTDNVNRRVENSPKRLSPCARRCELRDFRSSPRGLDVMCCRCVAVLRVTRRPNDGVTTVPWQQTRCIAHIGQGSRPGPCERPRSQAAARVRRARRSASVPRRNNSPCNPMSRRSLSKALIGSDEKPG
jgi:hypothetical protein